MQKNAQSGHTVYILRSDASRSLWPHLISCDDSLADQTFLQITFAKLKQWPAAKLFKLKIQSGSIIIIVVIIQSEMRLQIKYEQETRLFFSSRSLLCKPGLFYHFFWSFQTNMIIIFTTNVCEKCPSSIWCLESNFQPT